MPRPTSLETDIVSRLQRNPQDPAVPDLVAQLAGPFVEQAATQRDPLVLRPYMLGRLHGLFAVVADAFKRERVKLTTAQLEAAHARSCVLRLLSELRTCAAQAEKRGEVDTLTRLRTLIQDIRDTIEIEHVPNPTPRKPGGC